ncbi:hypothetical protein SBX64_07660 [Vibrio rhizosphaerae]|uniref:Uncharacterized protein n=1 Tax=Vibrio rhizosphaerae TaxID=398736 RepID=A0ABU4IVU9_9VIBR|nr:hypothetical protein [Vibrio rhizosphaerae]MDW6092419.1 hypothetical protein [Vibrio rhizosphaerae]
MMKIEVVVEDQNGIKQNCHIDISKSESWNLFFWGIKIQIEIEASDLFIASTVLREHLEQRNCKLLCNASRRNIFVSTMSREMGGGRKGYIVQIGQPASRDTLVDIFGYVDSSLVVSIEEQQLFHEKWIESLRG